MKSFLIFIFLISNIIIYSQENYTLNDLLQFAFKNNSDIKISKSKVISTEAKIDEVNSQYLPQFKAFASYTRLSDSDPFQIKLPVFNEPVQVGDVILNNYNLKLSVNQQIFTGFRLNSQKNASSYLNKAAQNDVIREKNEAANNVINAYWNLYKVMQSALIIQENISAIEKHIEDTKNFMNNGLATMNDLLKLEVQLSNLKLSLIEIQNNIELARLNLNKASGLPLENRKKINFEKPGQIIKNELPVNLINEAKENRTEIKILKLKILSNRENVTAVSSGYYPSVSLFGNFYLSNPNLRYQPPKNKFYSSWDAGVMLSWDIWNWGLTSSQKIQTEQVLIQSQENLEQLKDNIEIEVNQAYLNYRYAIEKIPVVQKLIEQSAENLRITQNKFNENLATSTEIIDAENSVFAAKLYYNNVLADIEIAKTKLDKAAGRKLY